MADRNGRAEMFGKWYEHRGCFYSNEGYKEKEKKRNLFQDDEYSLCDCCSHFDCAHCDFYQEVMAWDYC